MHQNNFHNDLLHIQNKIAGQLNNPIKWENLNDNNLSIALIIIIELIDQY